MYTDIKDRISAMGELFVVEELADDSITAIDSTLLKANGHAWHKSSMKKGIVPHPGINTVQDGGDTVVPRKMGFRI